MNAAKRHRRPSGVILASLVVTCVSCSPLSSVPERGAASAPSERDLSWPNYEDPTARDYIAKCRQDFGQANLQFRALESEASLSNLSELLDQLNHLDVVLDRMNSRSTLFHNVHPQAAVRAAAEVCQQQSTALGSDIALSRPLYNHLAKMELVDLSPLDQRFVHRKREAFERAGVNRNAQARRRIKVLNDEIVKIGQEFGRNIREDVRFIKATRDELEGLPEDFIDGRPVDENGKITITTNSPDYSLVMQYAQSDFLRLRLYQQYRQRGYPANKKTLRALLQKRYQLAQLLGFDNYAQFITSDKMIESPQNAAGFIRKINQIVEQRAAQDYAILLARLREDEPGASAVGEWQKDYLEDRIKKEVYQVDSQAVRQYFAYGDVRDGLFHLVETLFDVVITPWDTEVWHQSVESYAIWDGGALIGQFYLDMHPRKDKYTRAAAFDVRGGVKGIQTPIKALVCNFPGGDGSRGLMEHGQVETFLHEFGHLLHSLFAGHQPWLELSGISTERDFVEAPSQMLEEWAWDKDTLKTFARNLAGEVIPDDLLEDMAGARNFGRGYWARHQLFYAALSLNYHNRPPQHVDLDKMMRELQMEYSPFGYVDGTRFYANFGHLNGYSAIYYTYLWSLVIASDMFSEFKQQGLWNKEVAARFRHAVLAPGGTKDAEDLVEDFLGRPYSFDAFAEKINGEHQ